MGNKQVVEGAGVGLNKTKCNERGIGEGEGEERFVTEGQRGEEGDVTEL